MLVLLETFIYLHRKMVATSLPDVTTHIDILFELFTHPRLASILTTNNHAAVNTESGQIYTRIIQHSDNAS